jgi:hypothetical protein
MTASLATVLRRFLCRSAEPSRVSKRIVVAVHGPKIVLSAVEAMRARLDVDA